MAFGSANSNGPSVGELPPPLQVSQIVQGPASEQVTWNHLKGKLVVLEFWNTRCGPCIQAIPHWNELAERFRDRPVVFLSISDDNPDLLEAFLKRKPIQGWLALDAPFKPTQTAFGVVGIPHTVIVDRTGKIAAITHPALLQAQHLEEILAGQPSSLPAQPALSPTDAPVVAVSNPPPGKVEISIEGPFPRPDGPWGARGWKGTDAVFQARKAPPQDVLAGFFRISPKLIFTETKLPEGLYDISAASAPDQLTELKRQFIAAVREKWGLDVQTTTREVSVYALAVCTTNAPGLKAVPKRAGGGAQPGGFYLGGSPMSSIASFLEHYLDKPVVDETGLTGWWAADLRWDMSAPELSAEAAPDTAKVIQAVRQQLGLDLRLACRRVSVLEIRSAQLE